MWMRAAGVLVALVATARAKTFVDEAPSREVAPRATPTLDLGVLGVHLSFDKLRVAFAVDDVGVTAKLTLSISTTEQVAAEAVLSIVLPEDAQVTGAAITLGKTQRMVAAAMTPEAANTAYERVLNASRDPVLVELEQSDAGRDTIRVRAFPLTRAAGARIELDLALPAIRTLAIESISTIGVVEAHGKRWRPGETIELAVPAPRARVAPLAVTARPRVSGTTSLYAGHAVPERVPIVLACGIRPPQMLDATVGRREILRTIKQHRPQLARCYTRVVEYSGGPEGTAVLHFLIGPSGRVDSVDTSGELADPRITSCLVEVASAFQFHAGHAAVQVNYPLHFRLAAPTHAAYPD